MSNQSLKVKNPKRIKKILNLQHKMRKTSSLNNKKNNKLKLKQKHPLKKNRHRQTSKRHKTQKLNLRQKFKMRMFQNLNLKKLHHQMTSKLIQEISQRSKNPIIKITRSLLMVNNPA